MKSKRYPRLLYTVLTGPHKDREFVIYGGRAAAELVHILGDDPWIDHKPDGYWVPSKCAFEEER